MMRLCAGEISLSEHDKVIARMAILQRVNAGIASLQQR